ncbi:hypothetical protein BS17DRAFT_365855 [Gyrodon lividus]|nr:hypothetical protein BS17DRAFT_365855 [Gyrodon lividus]
MKSTTFRSFERIPYHNYNLCPASPSRSSPPPCTYLVLHFRFLHLLCPLSTCHLAHHHIKPHFQTRLYASCRPFSCLFSNSRRCDNIRPMLRRGLLGAFHFDAQIHCQPAATSPRTSPAYSCFFTVYVLLSRNHHHHHHHHHSIPLSSMTGLQSIIILCSSSPQKPINLRRSSGQTPLTPVLFDTVISVFEANNKIPGKRLCRFLHTLTVFIPWCHGDWLYTFPTRQPTG